MIDFVIRVVKWLAIAILAVFATMFFLCVFMALSAVLDTSIRHGLTQLHVPHLAQTFVLFGLCAVWIWQIRARKSGAFWIFVCSIFLAIVVIDVFAHSWGTKLNLF